MVAPERRLPPSALVDPERARDFFDLHEDVPDWLREELLGWMKSVCGEWFGIFEMDEELRSSMQLALRTEIPRRLKDLPTERYLDVIDYLLAEKNARSWHQSNLERTLAKGGSAWRVTPRGLERRIDDTLQGTAEATFKTGTRPAQHLRDAWHRAWRRESDASGAYREAVRAVEAAYAPIVSPKNERATLGTIIADIKNKPSKFRVRLQADEPRDNVDRVVGMLQMLWKSQLDRHGTPDEEVPLNVSLEEAQDAVALAASLVHLAQHGGFTANRS